MPFERDLETSESKSKNLGFTLGQSDVLEPPDQLELPY